MRLLLLAPLAAALVLLQANTGCVRMVDPDPEAGTWSSDSLRYEIEPSFAGRMLGINWYHVSYSSPLAERTLGSRRMTQVLPLTASAGKLALPAQVDSLFEFYARFAQYAADEAAGKLKPNFADSAAWYQAHRHWGLAPLVATRTDEMASMTLAQIAKGAKPMDSVAVFGDHVLLWVRDSLVADHEALLVKRKLTGRFGAGWHLLRYKDADRSLERAPFTDTVKFRAATPKPNLM